MAIRMRRGNEADFDPSKMLPGEWAVSTDTKYVRMCFSPGIVLRMATYEAFESDMAEIRNILSQCQNIQTAVKLIQQNVTNSELVIENYVKEAKQYRDEAEQFRNEASMFAPEGYEDLVKNVSDNTVKIDTIIEKAELNIKNNARGSNIHLTDSAESNVVALELYGKTEQNAYTGKNKYKMRDSSGTTNTVKVEVNDDGTVNFSSTGAVTTSVSISLMGNRDELVELFNIGGTFVMSLKNGVYNSSTFNVFISYKDSSDGTGKFIIPNKQVTIPSGSTFYDSVLYVASGVTIDNVTNFAIQLEKGDTVTDFEPYVGGMPSPSPSYPQEIKSVVLNTIKTHGKNLLDCSGLTETTTNGVTFTPVYENGKLQYINANGASTNAYFNLGTVIYPNECVLNGCPTGHSISSAMLFAQTTDGFKAYFDVGNGITIPANTELNIFARIASGYTANNLKFYPMISKDGGEFQPYQTSEITLSKPIELNGFNGVYDVVTSDGVTRRFAKVVFDGSDDESCKFFIDTTSGNYQFQYTLANNANRNILCSHFTNSNVNAWATMPDNTYMVHTTNYEIIRFENNNITTLADWKTWLSENLMTVVYELATQTTEELQTDFTALKTFYPETHVSNDADCDMSITYTADAKNYIDNKIALLTTALYNNI